MISWKSLSTVTITILACVPSIAAQVPTLINYQGRLVDASGTPLETANRDLSLQIFDAPTGGTLVYGPQSMPSTPVVNGYYNVLLGPVDEANPARPIEAAFLGAERYLEVTVNGTPMSPRQRILSVPYAFQALSAKTADSVIAGGITADMIANDAVGSAQIKSGAVGSDEIENGAVTSPDIASNAVKRENILDGEITTSKFAPNAVAPEANFSTLRFQKKDFAQYTWPDDGTLYDVPGAAVTINPEGRPVEIFPYGSRIEGPRRPDNATYTVEFVRVQDNEVVAIYGFMGISNQTSAGPILLRLPTSSYRAFDFAPLPGANTYKLRIGRQGTVPDAPDGGNTIFAGTLVAIAH